MSEQRAQFGARRPMLPPREVHVARRADLVLRDLRGRAIADGDGVEARGERVDLATTPRREARHAQRLHHLEQARQFRSDRQLHCRGCHLFEPQREEIASATDRGAAGQPPLVSSAGRISSRAPMITSASALPLSRSRRG